jgi:hypothetical protein
VPADAINRFKTIAFGDTALKEDQAHRLLDDAGFTDIVAAPASPGSPAVTLGRKASSS